MFDHQLLYKYAMVAAIEHVHQRVCCVHGYHVYCEIWEAAVDEVLVCEREPRNTADRYAVALQRSVAVIGHLPKKISQVFSLFLRRRGDIHCSDWKKMSL